ncbi:hypothetical protein [Halomonas sp.]|uniref:hypothetical protein n=1 Tax=Halomonas sp. TaxID=1486246 RepID=UPI000C925414|nr:hypothetical protein [Halomonas sp.]MAR74354.1 hypothetical protein [Halomonas sp.]|tara:strand:- start:7555 stop:7941 length:387 start_codon:yes stop_codon:yes gene_type:complete
MIVAIYCELSGLIQRVTQCPEDHVEMQCGEHEDYIEVEAGFDDAAHYVDLEDGQIKPKQHRDAQVAVEGLTATITGLEPGTLLAMDGQQMVTTSDSAQLDVDVPGTYQIHLVGPAWRLNETLEVTIDG